MQKIWTAFVYTGAACDKYGVGASAVPTITFNVPRRSPSKAGSLEGQYPAFWLRQYCDRERGRILLRSIGYSPCTWEGQKGTPLFDNNDM